MRFPGSISEFLLFTLAVIVSVLAIPVLIDSVIEGLAFSIVQLLASILLLLFGYPLWALAIFLWMIGGYAYNYFLA